MTFDEWFQSKQGAPYESMYLFARDAWNDAVTTEREACAKVAEKATKLNQVRNFVRSKRPNAECFFIPGKYEITDNETADDLGRGTDELEAWADAADQLGYNVLLYGGTCPVPKTIAVCPECGGNLHAESIEWVEETGVPTTGGLYVDCEHEESQQHRYWQSDWQSVINAVEKWCGAEAA